MNSLEQVLSKLELTEYNGLYYYGKKETWENTLPYWIKRALDVIQPNAFYRFGCDNSANSPFILFFDNPSENKELLIHKQVWNFNQAPVIFIIKNAQIEIFNGFVFEKKESRLQLISNKEKEWEKFSLYNLQSGLVWEDYRSKFRNDKRVDHFLLENINESIRRLSKLNLERELANNLIGRLIFSRYLIDRNVNIDTRFICAGTSEERKKSFLKLIVDKPRLYQYFKYLKEKFNGNLFPLIEFEEQIVEEAHLDVLYDLFSGTEVKTGQQSLFDIYDFSIIPIELISNIYERFIGDEKQEKEKAFYTPLFLVDYVLSQTVEPFLSSSENATCKILDPACGSGIFLVEALRKIIEKHHKLNSKVSDDCLRSLVTDNIFGVDKDENAINVAIFSLYITLLDYKEPRDIETFRFPVLKETNFFTADIFDLSHRFNGVLSEIDFNFIVGNPPWGRIKNELHINYINTCNMSISNYQVSQSFLVRVKDFSKSETKCALIVSSKTLYNLNAYEFRNKFLKEYYINKILELSIVRRKIFSKAIGPGAVIFYQYAFGRETAENTVEHISLKPSVFFNLFKTIAIEKYDYKEVRQKYFSKYDWLWKVLLYGNVLDFRFIKNLKENLTLEELLTENEISYGGGFKALKASPDNNDKYYPELKNLKLITPELLRSFNVDVENANFNKIDSFERLNKENLKIYNAPHILIKRTINEVPVAAYTEENCIFSNLIHGMSGCETKKQLLKSIAAFISSDLSRYLLFLLASQWGIERDEIYIEEILRLPIASDLTKNELFNDVDKISDIINTHKKVINFTSSVENEIAIEEHIKTINDKVAELYSLDSIDIDLINYVTDVSIPIFKDRGSPYKPASKEVLEDYAQIFIEHFGSRFKKYEKGFKIQIFKHDYLTAMNFVVTEEPIEGVIEYIDEKEINSALKLMGVISWQKISSNLFIQKDIKGFEESSFFVIKPNEYKNWHRAIARLDLSEFMDAIIKSGKEELVGSNNA